MSDPQDLMKKLYNLAQRGVGGEKISAQEKLNTLLEKNNMTLDDLQEDIPKINYFEYHSPYEKKLLCQIFYKVMGASSDYQIYTPNSGEGKYTKLAIMCTAAQKIEIDLDFDFYKRALDEEMEYLYQGFIQKMMIFPSDAPTNQINMKELSPEDLAKLKKQMRYANDVDYKTRKTLLEEK